MDQVYQGGNGNDTIYAPYEQQAGETKLVGGGGKDIISNEFYDGITGVVTNMVDLTIWGDWDYGENYGTSDGLDQMTQYGDPRLEKKLHGDDD